jgi:hypothetical protein
MCTLGTGVSGGRGWYFFLYVLFVMSFSLLAILDMNACVLVTNVKNVEFDMDALLALTTAVGSEI